VLPSGATERPDCDDNFRQENAMQSDEGQGFADKVQAKLAEMKTLKDEIKVNLRLATMQLRDEWKSLESKLPDPATVRDQLKDKAADTLDKLTEELKAFSVRLRSGSGGNADGN
jgi:hypothetical protein